MATPKAKLVFPAQVHRWTVDEYHKVGATGLFDDRRVELIEGDIFDMATMLSPHATSVTLADDVIRQAFGGGWVVRVQVPLTISEITEPMPDIAVVAGKTRDFKDAHPKSAALVVEIAESSVDHDRNVKAGLYAQAEVQDYWILNLIERRLEVYRHPIADTKSKTGYSYAEKLIFSEGDSVSPIAKTDVTIAVADLLP